MHASPVGVRRRGQHSLSPFVGILQVLLGIELGTFALSTIPGVRGHSGFDGLLDGWLQGAGYLTAASLCLLRVFATPVLRWIWCWFAAALAARAFAFVVYLSVVRNIDPLP